MSPTIYGSWSRGSRKRVLLPRLGLWACPCLPRFRVQLLRLRSSVGHKTGRAKPIFLLARIPTLPTSLVLNCARCKGLGGIALCASFTSDGTKGVRSCPLAESFVNLVARYSSLVVSSCRTSSRKARGIIHHQAQHASHMTEREYRSTLVL